MATPVAMAPCDGWSAGHNCWMRTALPSLDPALSCAELPSLTFVPPPWGGGAVSALRIRSFPLALLQGTAEAVRLGSGFDYIGAGSDAVDQRLAEPGVGNNLGPFRERQIGGNDYRRLFSPFCDDLEQKLCADLGQGHVSHFVERDQIVASPAGQRAAELQLMFGLDQFVDQPGGAGEAHSAFLPAGRHRQAGQ